MDGFSEKTFINDIFNDGINFNDLFNKNPSFKSAYEETLNLLTDQSLQILPKSFKASSILNLQQKLSSMPKINELISIFRLYYMEYKDFIDLYGPIFCLNYNINYQVLKSLADYIFINEENDGIIIENIFNILQIPTNWVPKATEILSRYDDIETISDLMSRLNVLPQYNDFIEKVNRLKIPKSENTKFFSISKITDCITSFIGLLNSIDRKVRNECKGIKLYLPKINPIDIQLFLEKIPEIINGIEISLRLMGYQTPIMVSNIFNEPVQLSIVIKNLTLLYKEFKNEKNSQNLKLLFDYLNIEKVWGILHKIFYHISEDSSLCDIFNLNTQQCDNLYMNIITKSRFLISNASFANSVSKDVTEFYIPLLKSLSSSSNISDLVSIVINILRKYTGNEKIDINLTNLYESLRIDSIMVSEKDLYESIYKHFSIIIEILKSIADSYDDENTGIDTMIKSIEPKSFLDFYQTFLKLSEVKSLKISELVNTISYDFDPSKTNFNDVLPIKTIAANPNGCKKLVNEMDQNVLYVKSLSKCIGKENLNVYFSKNIINIISFYIGMIIGLNINLFVPNM